jgi:hypothetical protein
VLIELARHHEVMFALIVIAVLIAVAVLSYPFGKDSRIDDVARRRGFTG